MSVSLRKPPVPLYLATFLIVGLSLSVLGPALSELRDRTGSDIGGIGVLFVGQSIGYFGGSLVAGRAYDRFNGHRVFAVALVALSVGLALVPAFESLGALFAAFVIIGVGASAADVGANTLLMWQLGAGVGRAMNTLHLCFGLGALAAPLLVHVGLGVAMLSAAVLCLVLASWSMVVPSPTTPVRTHHRDDPTDAKPRLLLLLATFFFLYVGLEVGFAGWVYTYGEEVQFSALAATWLTTVFWIGFTLGRLLSSLLAQRWRPKMVLAGACPLAVVAAVVLVIGDGRTGAVWAGAALMGLATAPQFPVMLTYLERRIRVTGGAMSWFVGAAGLGSLAFPWLIGRWFDSSGAGALPWSMVMLSVLTLASFGASNRVLSTPQ